jgi:NAD(P)-dependent dehydrogenase (short-subunit alcohol dehydrogenase family)
MARLPDRRIVITGGASGIGLATARMFAREGAGVAILDRDRIALAGVKAEQPELVTLEVDGADNPSVEAAIRDAAGALGGIDGVVNCAGIDLVKRFDQMNMEEWSSIMAVNVTGPAMICRAALPHLQRARGGTIVNVSSGAALRPLEHRTAYCSSKAALVMFSKVLAIDLAADNIRVNAICPGIVDTPMFRASYEGVDDPEAELHRILDRYVIKRAADPDELAAAILFATSDESSFMTGSAIAVDGGRTFH